MRDYLSREAILTRKRGVQSQTRLCRTRLKLFGLLHRCDLFLRSFPLMFQTSKLWLLEDESQIVLHKIEFESRSYRIFFPFWYQSDGAWRRQTWQCGIKHLSTITFCCIFFVYNVYPDECKAVVVFCHHDSNNRFALHFSYISRSLVTYNITRHSASSRLQRHPTFTITSVTRVLNTSWFLIRGTSKSGMGSLEIFPTHSMLTVFASISRFMNL